MSAVVKLNGVTVGTTSWLARGFGEPGPEIANAADGTGSFGGIVFEDPAGSLAIQGWEAVSIDETDCTSAPRLQTGYVDDHSYSRGKYTSSAGREIDCTILDQNYVFSNRLITGADGKRPAETHIERIDWLLGSAYLSGLITDLGLVDRSNPRPFEEADYRGRYPNQVLGDLAAPITRIFFAYWDQTAMSVGLFFDTADSTSFTSTLSLSNVASDVNNSTCFAPWENAVLKRDASEVYSKVRFTYKNGTVIETDATTESTFFVDNGLLYRGLQVDNSRVGLESTARSMAQNILARDSVEHDTITCTVELPSTYVGLIQAGQRLSVRFSHFPGYTSFTYTRVERLSIRQRDRNGKLYEVTLTLSTKGLSGGGPGGGGAPGPGGFPHPPPSSGWLVQSTWATQSPTFLVPPTDGNLLLMWMTERSTGTYPPTPSGWTSIATTFYGVQPFARLAYKIASGESVTPVNFGTANISGCLMEWEGVTVGSSVTRSDINNTAFTAGGAITPASAGAIVVGCGLIFDFFTGTVTTGAGETLLSDNFFGGGNSPMNWVAYKNVPTIASTTIDGTIVSSFPHWGGVTVTLLPAASDNPPSPGQWVYGETLTMVGAVGTTDFPYAAGSPIIRVDGVLISHASYTETDPAAGTITLSWIPDADETVTVDYQGI